LSEDTFNILAVKNGNKAFRALVPIHYDSSGNVTGDTLRDTLRAPGTVRGVVRLLPGHDSRNVLILAVGTNRLLSPDDSVGNFALDSMAAGTYPVRFLVAGRDYRPFDTMLTVGPGKETVLDDTIYLEYTGIPVPQKVHSAYDPVTQVVRLSWQQADTALTQGYVVYRRHQDSNAVKISAGFMTDTFFVDSLDGGPAFDSRYCYSVASVDSRGNESLKSIEMPVDIQGNSTGWSVLGDIAPRKNAYACVINDTLYCAGGENETGALDDLIRYNPATDSWTPRAPIPEPRKGAGIVATDSTIWYFAGLKTNIWFTSIYRYSTKDNTWNIVSYNWLSGNSMATTAISDSIYCLGGEKYPVGICDSLFSFSTGITSIERKKSMSRPRTGHSTIAYMSHLYAFGGWDGTEILNSVESYSLANDEWSDKSPMPHARMSFCCVHLNGVLYAAGGKGNAGILDVNEAYDPSEDRWSRQSPIPTARQGAASAVFNNRIYVIGGETDQGISGAVEVYDPLLDP
ncbi:MAG: hypothetical protein GF350_06980, partial [Chitinivibrionales bacterium]|nr:hypothetical protein [Chitinivibrionales bacterium]